MDRLQKLNFLRRNAHNSPAEYSHPRVRAAGLPALECRPAGRCSTLLNLHFVRHGRCACPSVVACSGDEHSCGFHDAGSRHFCLPGMPPTVCPAVRLPHTRTYKIMQVQWWPPCWPPRRLTWSVHATQGGALGRWESDGLGYPSARIRSSASLTLDRDHRRRSASSGPIVPSHPSKTTRAASAMPLSSR